MKKIILEIVFDENEITEDNNPFFELKHSAFKLSDLPNTERFIYNEVEIVKENNKNGKN